MIYIYIYVTHIHINIFIHVTYIYIILIPTALLLLAGKKILYFFHAGKLLSLLWCHGPGPLKALNTIVPWCLRGLRGCPQLSPRWCREALVSGTAAHFFPSPVLTVWFKNKTGLENIFFLLEIILLNLKCFWNSFIFYFGKSQVLLQFFYFLFW